MGRWMAPFVAVLINRSDVNPIGPRDGSARTSVDPRRCRRSTSTFTLRRPIAMTLRVHGARARRRRAAAARRWRRELFVPEPVAFTPGIAPADRRHREPDLRRSPLHNPAWRSLAVAAWRWSATSAGASRAGARAGDRRARARACSPTQPSSPAAFTPRASSAPCSCFGRGRRRQGRPGLRDRRARRLRPDALAGGAGHALGSTHQTVVPGHAAGRPAAAALPGLVEAEADLSLRPDRRSSREGGAGRRAPVDEHAGDRAGHGAATVTALATGLRRRRAARLPLAVAPFLLRRARRYFWCATLAAARS